MFWSLVAIAWVLAWLAPFANWGIAYHHSLVTEFPHPDSIENPLQEQTCLSKHWLQQCSALQPACVYAWGTLGIAGCCARPGQQAQDSLSSALLTSSCFAISNDQQKDNHTMAWSQRLFFLYTEWKRKLFLQFILYFKISRLLQSNIYYYFNLCYMKVAIYLALYIFLT